MTEPTRVDVVVHLCGPDAEPHAVPSERFPCVVLRVPEPERFRAGDDPLPGGARRGVEVAEKLAAQLSATKAERDRALALLRRLEWRPNDTGWRFCPICGSGRHPTHDAACELAALLGSEK